MTTDLTGRRVLVTGGATGLGAAISRALADAGATVAVAQRDERELSAALAESGLEGRVTGLVADLSVPGAAGRLVDEAIAALGGLDGLVNNAAVTGPPAHRAVLDIDPQYLDLMLSVNLASVIEASVAAGRHMAAGGGGTIVSIASVLATLPAPGASLYSATKAGLQGFTRGIALELGDRGVRAVTVSPGDIATPSSVAPPASGNQRAVREPVLGRRGEPREIGDVVAFLLGDGASYLTGTDVVVDGGFLLG